MRAIDCPCGPHVATADDEELLRLWRERVGRDHPELRRGGEQTGARIAADAYELAPVA